MDLVAGARRVVVAMQHMDKKGNSKLLEECSLPLTGVSCIDRIVTDMAVVDVSAEGFVLREIAPSFTVEEVKQATAAHLSVAEDLKTISF